MARVLLVLCLALFATAILAEDHYSLVQMNEIMDRTSECLKEVPAPDYKRSGCDWQSEGFYSLIQGAQKEDLIQLALDCLSTVEIDETILSSVQTCLTDSLTEDLVTA